MEEKSESSNMGCVCVLYLQTVIRDSWTKTFLRKPESHVSCYKYVVLTETEIFNKYDQYSKVSCAGNFLLPQ